MRIADKMAYNQVNSAISKNRSEMASLQNQAATQKRVTKPSDDPVAAARVLGNRIDLRGNEQYIKNLNYAKGFLDFTEQSLGELSDVVVRAKELAISQSSDASASAQSRRVVAEEVKQLYNQVVQIANRKLGERFIFGGFKTNEVPFDEVGNYRGDAGEMKVHINKESFLPMNIPGSVVFEGKGLSVEGFSFKSEPQARNVQELQEQREQAEKVGHSVDGAQMRGPASIRTTGNVAPTQETQNLEERLDNVKISDGVNLFNALKGLQVSLETNDKMGIQESLDTLDNALQQVITARSALGSRVNTVDNTLNSLHTTTVDNKTNISNLEDADAFQVISDINKTESALQATMQTSGKLLQKSLMDFIS